MPQSRSLYDLEVGLHMGGLVCRAQGHENAWD